MAREQNLEEVDPVDLGLEDREILESRAIALAIFPLLYMLIACSRMFGHGTLNFIRSLGSTDAPILLRRIVT